MVRPGYDLRIGAEAGVAVGLIERAFIERGFTLKSAPGVLPAELSYGSTGLTFVLDVLSDNGLPLFAVPSIWKKRKAMKARIATLETGASGCVLRVEVRTAQISASTTAYFVESVSGACDEVRAQGLSVEIEGPTDSAAA
jgi:hypothetical protein